LSNTAICIAGDPKVAEMEERQQKISVSIWSFPDFDRLTSSESESEGDRDSNVHHIKESELSTSNGSTSNR
jgi:hypothetical protein